MLTNHVDIQGGGGSINCPRGLWMAPKYGIQKLTYYVEVSIYRTDPEFRKFGAS